ncbi:MAG: bifunctional riboflavin kinase/FAD synthetase [Bacteroidota bacterium]
MNIIEGQYQFDPPKNAVVTIGTFDGVHYGHQKILKRVTSLAEKLDGESVVVTFWPHPRFILKPDDDKLKLLSSFEEKAQLMGDAGIDYIVKIPFTTEFSRLTSEEFTQKVLVDKLNTRRLVIGYDHRFGKNREGGFDYLKANEDRFGFQVEEIPKQEIDDVSVSSTKIRNALLSGDLATASNYLGRDYTLSGKVVPGNKLGRTLGFPTANINVAENYKLIPADGVYAIRAVVNRNHIKGMMNIGVRPTVDGTKRKIEAHLFDFNQDIYGVSMDISLVGLIRPEVKFDSTDALRSQLEIDRTTALGLLG